MPIHTCPSCQTTFEVKALPGEHVDYQQPSEPGKQTAVPPGAARLAMATPTHEVEVAIPDERYKREGGLDTWMKGLEPVDEADPLDDVVTPPSALDGDLFAEPAPAPEPEPQPIERGTKVMVGGLRGVVDMVVLAGLVPRVDRPFAGTKADPAVRVRLLDGTFVPAKMAEVVPQ